MLRYNSSQCKLYLFWFYPFSFVLFFKMVFQVFEESTRDKIFNISFTNPTFILKKLPSDTKLIIKVNITFTREIFLFLFSQHFPKFKINMNISNCQFQQITPYNLQGTCNHSYRLRVKTMSAPILRTGMFIYSYHYSRTRTHNSVLTWNDSFKNFAFDNHLSLSTQQQRIWDPSSWDQEIQH